MDSNNIIAARIANLKPEYTEYVFSDDISKIATTLGKEEGFSDGQIEILTNAFRLWLLFFLNKSSLTEFIVTDCDASNVVAEQLVRGFLLVIPETIKVNQQVVYDSLKETNPVEKNNLGAEISEMEKELEGLQGIRTMAEDMQTARQNEPVHNSSQDDILQKPESPEVSSESIPSTPRWGSEA